MTQPDSAPFPQSQEQKQWRQSFDRSPKSQFHASQRRNHSRDHSIQASQRFEQAYQTEDQSKVSFLTRQLPPVSPNFSFPSPPSLLPNPAFRIATPHLHTSSSLSESLMPQRPASSPLSEILMRQFLPSIRLNAGAGQTDRWNAPLRARFGVQRKPRSRQGRSVRGATRSTTCHYPPFFPNSSASSGLSESMTLQVACSFRG